MATAAAKRIEHLAETVDETDAGGRG